MRQELEGNGWIKVHRLPTGRRGTFALVELMPKAWELLRRLQVKVEPPRGKGDLVHRYYQWLVMQWARERGLEAEIEHGFPGK